MWSQLSSNTTPTFSACSLDKMKSVLGAACVTDNIDVGVTITAQPEGNPYRQAVTITVFNQDAARVAPQVTSTTDFSPGTQLSGQSAGCTILGTQLTCRHAVLGANSLNAMSVSAEFTTDAVPIINSELTHGAFTDTQQLNDHASLQLDFTDNAQPGVILSSSPAINDSPAVSPASGVTGQSNQQDVSNDSAAGGSAGVGSVGPFSLLCAGLFALCTVARSRRICTGRNIRCSDSVRTLY
jgi:hypothetical protein